MCCNIEVDVNGEHIFFLDKKVLASFSNRVRKLLVRLTNNAKLIFSDFPGGADSFELITSFCYNNGNIDITPSNIFLLHSASSFMEMSTLTMQTELFLEGTYCWTWSQFVNGLKQCQILFHFMNNSPTFQDYLNNLLGNLTLPSYISSSCQSSSNSSSFPISSSDTISKCLRSNNHLDYWKIDDLYFLNIELFDKLIKSMIFLQFDHPSICSFIFHYQKSKYILCCSHDEKSKISETNINLLVLLKSSAFSCRALLDAFGMSLSLNMKMDERSKLENLLGSRLHEFRINDLLIRGKKKGAFDVGLILRLIKIFLLERRINGFFVHRAKKVGFLMDLFMLEVAPDPLLKHSKFISLAISLPKLARESHDRMYHAINLYVEVHQDLCQEQKTKIWSAIDLNKLSVATMRLHLAKNTKLLPSVKQNQFKVFINDDFGVSRRVDNTVRNEKCCITFSHLQEIQKSQCLRANFVESNPCHQKYH
ncbi:SKP1/BTB/POZ domain, NPH3 domain protein [Artemisia annua]|uniref:SKP1/BTB/POZ domain, NPH3 domain protein n=1 Tax=Artemisia annua TaxID=35608 RepID=A0A2U1LIQ8_ARTAN|nr:SKP1/BTB/POZ domain, NPH3 domain protein [Artemisia annua]